MKMLRPHPNVAQLLGVCTNPSTPLCIVTEFVQLGNLHDILHDTTVHLKLKVMLEMCKDIVRGMLHLHSENMLHRDLAARNLLVGVKSNGDYLIKVSDFGMASLVDTSGVYSTNNKAIPVRWSAPEVLAMGTFSRRSDVFSFGIVMYEIFDRKIPYVGLSNAEVITKVEEGYRLPRPLSCPADLYKDGMLKCWNTDADSRPTFDELYQILSTRDAKDTNKNSLRLGTTSPDEELYINTATENRKSNRIQTAFHYCFCDDCYNIFSTGITVASIRGIPTLTSFIPTTIKLSPIIKQHGIPTQMHTKTKRYFLTSPLFGKTKVTSLGLNSG